MARKNACFLCGPNLVARYSHSLKKVVYENHRKYLHEGHPFRDTHRRGFGGRVEREMPPKRMSVEDWRKLWEESQAKPIDGMKRLSIFHRLEYWNNLLINHLLDPMHIFKNVGESIWKHLIGEKDTIAARHDLKESNTKKEYWIKDGEDHAPKVPWTFTKDELNHVCSIIHDIRTPTGFAHSLRASFTVDGKLQGLKSHDWLKMIQFIYPLSIRGCLSKDICETIYKLSIIVRYLHLLGVFFYLIFIDWKFK